MYVSDWETERVRLRAVEPRDWKIHFEWDRTTDIGRLTDDEGFPQSEEMVRRWAEDEALKLGANDCFRFQLEEVATGELVGTLNTHTCIPRHGTFSYGVAILPAHQRKGFASDAIRLLLRHFFAERRYQKCNTQVYSINEPSMRLHEHLGFVLEGRLRRMKYTQGAYHDVLIYGMTDEEFYVRHGK
jgi:RimJ/RimL family protein N-acetyltransferase